MSPDVLFDLDNDTVTSLAMCVDVLTARETLNQLRISDYPMMKQEARRKLFQDLKKQANPRILKEERKALTTKDLAAILNMR